MEIASSLRSLWDHMRHVKGINLFLPSVATYHRASMYLVFQPASPALSLFLCLFSYLFFPPLSHRTSLSSPLPHSSAHHAWKSSPAEARLRVALSVFPCPSVSPDPGDRRRGFNVVWGAELFSRRGGVPSARSPQKRDHTVEAEALNLNMNEAYSHHVDES